MIIMAKRKSTKKQKEMKNPKAFRCPIYKNKNSLKMLFRGDKAIGLIIKPMDFKTCCKISDDISENGFSLKRLMGFILPNIEKYVEISPESEITIDIKSIKENDPNLNPLSFSEIKEVIDEIITISNIIPNEEIDVNNEILGYVEIEFNKPLGIMECAEISDILTYKKSVNKKIYDLLKDEILDYINIRSDFDFDVDTIKSEDTSVNPFTFDQYFKIIRNILTTSKVLPGDLEPFLRETE
jgi:hypothetical protein